MSTNVNFGVNLDSTALRGDQITETGFYRLVKAGCASGRDREGNIYLYHGCDPKKLLALDDGQKQYRSTQSGYDDLYVKLNTVNITGE